MLRRLMRTLAEHPYPDLLEIAREIVSDEERLGHEVVAKELRRILELSRSAAQPPAALRPLPSTQNASQPAARSTSLGTLIHSENLRSTMVLAPKVEARFRKIEEEYTRRDHLARYGLKPLRRILLHGPPGCGKSLGAQRLAANLGLPLYRVHFDAVVSSYLGETAANLRRVFEAPLETPRLLLLDECDFLGSSRVGRSDVAEMSRTVNTLLDLVERFDGPGLLVATTNLYEQLDPALYRRFDDVVLIPSPSVAEIERLLRLSLEGVPVDPKLKWGLLASKLIGSSAARIIRIGAEAAKSFVLSGATTAVTRAHLDSAVELIPLDGG